VSGLDEIHHLVGRILAGGGQVRQMLKWDDQDMPGGVGENIEDHKIKLGTLEDKLFLIRCRACKN